jgi:hypothetical protein
MYSFPRTTRFEDFKRSTGPDFYTLPNMMTTRGASFGYGKKSDFTSSQKAIKASFGYNPTDFDTKKPKSPAYTFGISRQFYEKVYNEAEFYHDKNFPGPGQYKYTKPFGSEAAKFSIAGRNKPASSKTKMPGPGTYPQLGIRPDGKYMFSRYKNTTGIVWGSSKEKRFRYKDFLNYVPGPGNYDMKPLINGQGRLFNSKFKSNMGKTISGKFMDPSSKLKTPGPGSYRIFSEFGIYESKHAKTEESNYARTEENFYQSKSKSKEKKMFETVGTNSNSVLNTDHTDGYRKK